MVNVVHSMHKMGQEKGQRGQSAASIFFLLIGAFSPVLQSILRSFNEMDSIVFKSVQLNWYLSFSLVCVWLIKTKKGRPFSRVN